VAAGATERRVKNDGGLQTVASVIMRMSSKEKQVIRYMGTRKNREGAIVYVFIVNGLEKEVRENALKQHPGCYEALPASAKAKIAANRNWLSKL
jgi:hypothetical protein